MKKREKSMKPGGSAKIIYLPLVCLLASGCSYYGGKLSYFELTNEGKKLSASQQAEEKFWASVRPKSTLTDALYRLGLHYQKTGEYDKAIGEFTKALQLDRNFCKAYNGIAMTYDLKQRCEPAHASYEQALQCAPDQAYTYNNYACSSLLCGNYGKGLDLLHQAENLATNDLRIKNNLRLAQTIAIRENLSEFITKEGLPLPAMAMREIPKAPLPEKGTPPEPTVSKVPEEATGPESTMEIATAEPAALGKPDEEPAVSLPALEPVQQPVQYPETAAEIAMTASDRPGRITPMTKDIPVGKTENSAPGPAISSPDPRKVAVEVCNGNGTTGMAKRSADFLRSHGFTVRSISNAEHFRFEQSTIYYKEEYLQAAKDLAALIPGTQHLEQVESMAKTSIGVKVLLGRDLVTVKLQGDHNGLADFRRQPEQSQAFLTASNNSVHY